MKPQPQYPKTPKNNGTSGSFYKTLQQKYMEHKEKQKQKPLGTSNMGSHQSYSNSKYGSNYQSTNQSRMKDHHNTVKKRSISGSSVRGHADQDGKAKGRGRQSDSDARNVLHIRSTVSVEQIQSIQAEYNVHKVATDAAQIREYMSRLIHQQNPKTVSIQISPTPSSPSSISKQKTPQLTPYLLPISTLFQKSTICIYSLCNTPSPPLPLPLPLFPCSTPQLYDMLSIRKQIKKQPKLLVQTNICNNSKTGVILGKLLDVVRERENSMREAGLPIQAVVIRITGVRDLHANSENFDVNRAYQQGESKADGQVQVEISVGSYGQLATRDINPNHKYVKIYPTDSPQSLPQSLPLLPPKKPQKQSQLKARIKTLQQQLEEKKKELYEQKKKIQNQETIEAELEDIVLPSERPMINIKKYNIKYSAKYGKRDRNDNHHNGKGNQKEEE